MLESYFSSRRFQSPFLRSMQLVSPLSALWAFLLGPVYYWRKRAPIEAILFGIAVMALLFVDDDGDFPGMSANVDLGSAILARLRARRAGASARLLSPKRLGRNSRGNRSVARAFNELTALNRLSD